MSDVSPTTWWSGRSRPNLVGEPDSSGDDQLVKALGGLAVLLLVPVGVVILFAVGWVSVWRRASARWAVLVAAGGGLWTWADGGVRPVFRRELASYPPLFHALISSHAGKASTHAHKAAASAAAHGHKAAHVAAHAQKAADTAVAAPPAHPVLAPLAHALWAGAPLGVLFGGLASAGYVWLVARRRARTPWLNQEVKRTPVTDRIRLARNPTRVARCIGAPPTGAELGVEPTTGERIVIDDTSLGGHVLIPGASGSGKTTTALRILHGAIRNGYPVVTVDLKASDDVAATLEAYAKRYGRPFYRWSLTGPTYYDPLASGDPSRRRDLLLGTMAFTEPLYRDIAANYLQVAFAAMDAVAPLDPNRSALADLISLLSMSALKDRVENFSDEIPQLHAQVTQLVTETDATQRSGVRGLAVRLAKLMNSIAGEWLSSPPEGGPLLDLRSALREGAVVCFSLDASNYEEIASTVASLIIQDLKTLSAEMRAAGNDTPAIVFVDEFAAIESVNIIGLLNKARDAAMPVILATQTLADLARQEPTFVDQVLGIVGTFVLHRTNTFDDSERLALLAGHTMGYRVAHTVEAFNSFALAGAKLGSATGRETVEQIQVRRLEAEALQALPPGHAYVLCKAKPANSALQHVRVIPADINADTGIPRPVRPVLLGATSPRPAPVGRQEDPSAIDPDKSTRDVTATDGPRPTAPTSTTDAETGEATASAEAPADDEDDVSSQELTAVIPASAPPTLPAVPAVPALPTLPTAPMHPVAGAPSLAAATTPARGGSSDSAPGGA